MAPSVAHHETTSAVPRVITKGAKSALRPAGSLDQFQKFDVTPVIGTEFKEGVQLASILSAPNSDELIRDLAILGNFDVSCANLVAQRNVVFFRNQEINIDQQQSLGTRLGELSGKPATSKLHIHPLTAEFSELGDTVTVISSESRKTYYGDDDLSKLASTGWHTEYLLYYFSNYSITFEKTPSDYAILKIHTLPVTGGDTLWASAYEAYDRLSPTYQKLLEGLTAVHDAKHFKVVADRAGKKLRTEYRGAPDNHGDELHTIHPVIRTNPVTGWKGLFVNKGYLIFKLEADG
jgi:alpha-ketoglutarate-dependent taurine dioxygenase